MIFSFIDTEQVNHTIPLMCRVLRVSRSGYYDWRVRPLSHRGREDADLAGRIERILVTPEERMALLEYMPSCAPRACGPGTSGWPG